MRRQKEKMEAKVEILSREVIKPSSPTPHESKDHKLSSIDQLVPSFFVSLIFFYQKQPCPLKIIDDPCEISQHLKRSLSESLTKFYPLAGKLNGNSSILCDDSGALFLEAKIHAPLSQAFQNAPLEKLSQFLPFLPFATGDDDKRLANYNPRNEIMPLLAVQISWFECGGNAIGVCISHKIADFMSLVEFMNSWAAASRGGGGESTNPVLVLKEPKFELGRQLFPPPESHFSFPLPPRKKVVLKRFLFDNEKLAELKQLATTTTASSRVKDPTRVEVVTAFLWKQFINVARAKNQAAKTITFTIRHAVNLRGRMSSLAAASSNREFPFGNFSILTSASFLSGSSSDSDPKEESGYVDLVQHTSNSLRKVNEDYVINSVIPFLNSLGGSKTSGMEDIQQQEMMAASDWFFTSWCRHPVYEVDFGWGKPIRVTPSGTARDNGAILMSTRTEDGIEAWIAMSEEEMALLPEELLSLQITHILPMNR